MTCQNCQMPLLEGEDLKHRNEMTCIQNLKRAFLYLVAMNKIVYNVPYDQREKQ